MALDGCPATNILSGMKYYISSILNINLVTPTHDLWLCTHNPWPMTHDYKLLPTNLLSYEFLSGKEPLGPAGSLSLYILDHTYQQICNPFTGTAEPGELTVSSAFSPHLSTAPTPYPSCKSRLITAGSIGGQSHLSPFRKFRLRFQCNGWNLNLICNNNYYRHEL